ncbi:unnamed protein product, partial [Allacma fusca]
NQAVALTNFNHELNLAESGKSLSTIFSASKKVISGVGSKSAFTASTTLSVGQYTSGCCKNFGPEYHLVDGRKSISGFDRVAPSAKFSSVGIQRHSCTSVASSISPTRLATNCFRLGVTRRA